MDTQLNMPSLNASPEEFIQQTFAPMIAVITSAGVDETCKKNNLNFTEMVKPFSVVTTEVSQKDVPFSAVTKNLRISFCDVNSKPPPAQVARSYFNHAISSNIHNKTKEVVLGEYKVDIPTTVPWYEAWRHTFLQVQSPSDHEFVKHYVGCLITISSLDPNPMELIAELSDKIGYQILSGNPNLEKWINSPSTILYTYLFLQDNNVLNSSKSMSTFEAMEATYGSQKCFLLSINSRADSDLSNCPDPWMQFVSSNISFNVEDTKGSDVELATEATQSHGEKNASTTPIIFHPLSPISDHKMAISDSIINETPIESNSPIACHGMFLTSDDINQIKIFVNEFYVKALSPHFEQNIEALNEQIVNKKGVSRSLLSATKRWFGTTKPGTPGNAVPPSAKAYPSDSHEMHLRKLGDLSFMAGHYQQAFNAYHSAKRDFYADGAWMHYAGALEMAALSAYMTNNDGLSRKVIEYFEDSITTYQHPCNLNQFATRATILSVECMRGKGLYGEAAKELIRMAGEDSDLRSAVLLEQAAYCFLGSPRPTMFRKYAFHMVLAGNRYSKASHKNHSMRCYHQAYQIYSNKSWMIAEDHILYTIGKHATQLKLMEDAFEALSLLVTRSSPQSKQQQQLFLRDYINTVQNLLNYRSNIQLNLPVIKNHLTQIFLSTQSDIPLDTRVAASGVTLTKFLTDLNRSVWLKLEEKLVAYATSTNLMIFNPVVEVVNSKTKESVTPIAVCGETIGMYVCLQNPLHIPIQINSMQITWDFILENGEQAENNIAYAISNVADEITLRADSTKYELLTIVPKQQGILHITGVQYNLSDALNSFNVNGSQIITSLQKEPFKNNLMDKHLQLKIIDKAPNLKVYFTGLKDKAFCYEIFSVSVNLKNIGELSISRILMTTSPNCSVWVKDYSTNESNSLYDIPLNENLLTGQSIDICIFIQPCHKKGIQNLELLFYYESQFTTIKPRYRLVKHSWPITVVDAFKLTAITSVSTAGRERDALNIRLQIDSESVTRTSSVMKMHIESVSISSSKWELGRWVIDPSAKLRGFSHMPFNCNEDMYSLQFSKNNGMEEDQRLFILIQALKKLNPSEMASISTNYLSPESKNEIPYAYFVPKGNFNNNCDIDIVCIVNWKLETSNSNSSTFSRGQEHLFLHNPVVAPNAFSSIRDLTKPLQNTKLVSCRIHLPQRCSHPFSAKRLCTIPIVLNLHNCSDHRFTIKVSTLFPKLPESHAHQSNSNSYSWVGQTTFTRIIEGASDICIQLFAAVTSTGAYDFSSGLNIEVKVLNEFVKQLCSFDSVILIY